MNQYEWVYLHIKGEYLKVANFISDKRKKKINKIIISITASNLYEI